MAFRRSSMASPGGFEPAVSGLKARCPDLLDDGDLVHFNPPSARASATFLEATLTR